MSTVSERRYASNRPLWLVVLSGALIVGIAMGIRQGFGLFLPHISMDLSLGRETFAFSMAMANLLWGLGAPFAGGFADKYGSLRIILFGACFYALGLYVLSAARTEMDLLIFGVFVGVGVSATGVNAIVGAVGRAAPEEKRTMAITIASMGSGVGMFAAVPYTHLLIEGLGWQGSLVALALTALVMTPLAFAIGDKGSASLPRSVQARVQPIGEALMEAIRLPRFWLLTVGFFVCGFHVMFVAVHLPAFVVDKGLAPWLGAAALSAVGVFNLIGTYIAGMIADKIGKPVVLCWLYALRAVVFLGFLFVPMTEVNVLVLCSLLGLLWLATVPITSSLVGAFFGPTWLSMLYGIVFFSHQLGAFAGVWMGGYVFDTTQSYDIVWWMCVGLGVLSALLHWPIKEQPVARLQAEAT